jgi:hypothetical protein
MESFDRKLANACAHGNKIQCSIKVANFFSSSIAIRFLTSTLLSRIRYYRKSNISTEGKFGILIWVTIRRISENACQLL